MMLSQQMTQLTDLTQMLLHALDTSNRPLAELTAKKLANLVTELNKTFAVLIHEEMRHLPH